MRRTERRTARLLGAVALVALAGCDREKREMQVSPGLSSMAQASPQVELQPGPPLPPPDIKNPFEKNQHATAEGKRLFSAFNCAGCHSPGGGGGIGPPLIDAHWIYGGQPANIFDTIVRGRPNGMPSFGGKLPEYQIWQLVTFVQSMALEPPQAKQK